MHLKRAIAAGALGALMAGSTLAFAASLADFPAPFVQAGSANFLVVVGEAAATADVAGAIDVAARLGGAPVVSETKTVACGGAGESVSGEGVQIKAPGEDFNYGESIVDVAATAFDKTDMPTLLAEGTYSESENTENDVQYTQMLEFPSSGTTELVFDTDDNSADEEAGTYLFMDAGTTPMFTYTLEFTDDVEYDGTSDTTVKEDFEDSQIEILGKLYTVTDATQDGTGALDMLELMGGAIETTLEHGASGTYTLGGKQYTISVRVYSTSGKAVFDVTGATTATLEISEGNTKKLPDGTELGLRSLLTSAKEGVPDSARFFVGAQKLELENGQPVLISGKEVDGWDTLVTIDSGVDTLSSISIDATPDDDFWVGVGDSTTDPIFNAWTLKLSSLTQSTEKIEATASGEDGMLKLKDVAGNDIKIPVMDDGSNVIPGDKEMSDADVYADGATGGNLMLVDGDYCDGDTDVTDCEGVKMLVSSSGGEARVIQITDIDMSNDEVDLKDLTTGKTWTNKDYTDGVATTIELGGFTAIDLNVNEGATTVTAVSINNYDAGDAALKTSKSADVYITAPGNVVTVEVFDDDGNGVSYFEFVDDTTGDVEIDNIADVYSMMPTEAESKIKVGLDTDDWGAITTWDSDNKDDLTVEYPEEATIANVWLLRNGASVVAGGGGTTSYTVQTVAPIKTMVAKLDSEFLALSAGDQQAKNVISVGGPCVNRVTAALLGKTYPACGAASGLTADTALIKLVENAFGGSKVALVVAGWEAVDTRQATSALQNYESAGLTGTEKVM